MIDLEASALTPPGAEMCNIMHADGAGTKSALAYMYWKETGDLSVWKVRARLATQGQILSQSPTDATRF